jgi:nucleosome binding factor SPN SPT16 subunit
MRFYGAEYNNIELGIRLVQYCCTLLHKTLDPPLDWVRKFFFAMTFQIHLATILRFMSMHKSIYTAKPEYYTTTALERDQ